MRALALAFILWLSILPTTPAFAQDFSRLLRNFDAGRLTVADKRFLQAALAFEGHYKGLLDGQWGSISQRSINEYSWKNFGNATADWHQALLALSYFQKISEDGWNIRYLDELGISFLVPSKAVTMDEPSDMFVNFRHTKSSLSYSVTAAAFETTERLHDFTLRFNEVSAPPYTVRKPDFLVTSGRNKRGTVLYTRSNFVLGKWATIMLSAETSDGNLLGAITSSIAVGQANPVMFTEDGDLHRAILLVLAMADQDEEARETTASPAPPSSESSGNATSSGTGFFVSAEGHVLTNAHVIKACSSVVVNERAAEVLAISEPFDLAIVQAEMQKLQTFASFANGPARLNADVTVSGYPYSGALGGLNVTRGAVSSLTGLGGNALQMQITAPVQSGNSGGPVIASDGTVIGVVVSKLDAELVADALGDVPQNVNFAVRGEIAKLFLSQNGVQPVLGDSEVAVSPTRLAENASAYTVYVECR